MRQATAGLRTRHALGTFVSADASLVAAGTPVKAVHLTERRTALDAVSAAAEQTLAAYTRATITGGVTVITAVDVTELRAAILPTW